MAVRCYAANAYPSLIGPSFRYIKALEKKNPEFVIRFERFEGYLLVWPEFRKLESLLNEDAWERYGLLRGFLRDWGALKGETDAVFRLYDKWIHDDSNPEGIPEGFVLEECLWYQRARENSERLKRGVSDAEEWKLEAFPRKPFELTRAKRESKNDKAVTPKEEAKDDRQENMDYDEYEDDDNSSYRQEASSVVGWEENLEYGDRSHDERVHSEKTPYTGFQIKGKAERDRELADRPNPLQNPNKIPLPRRPADHPKPLQNTNEIPLPRRPADFPDPLQNPNKLPLLRRQGRPDIDTYIPSYGSDSIRRDDRRAVRRSHSPSRGRDTRMIDSYRPRPDDEKKQSRDVDRYRPSNQYRPRRH